MNLFPKRSGSRIASVRAAPVLKDLLAAAGKSVPSARTGIGPPAARAARGGARRPAARAVSVRHAPRANAVGARSQIGERARVEIARLALKKGAAVANAPHSLRAGRPGRKPGNAPAGNRARNKGTERPRSRFRAVEGGERSTRPDRGPERSGEDAQGPRPDRSPYRPRRNDESHGGAEKPKSFGKPFRRDRDGDLTSRPSWRDREAGEQRAPGNDAPGERPTRPERRPYRQDEGAGGKPRSFGKPGFKGPRRETSARGDGGERRTAGSDAPGERPTRPERRPYRQDEGRRAGNRGHSGSPASKVRGVKHRRAVTAANSAPLGAMLQENGRSVPRGVRIEKTKVRARVGSRGHSGSSALKGRGVKHRRAESRRTTRPEE